MSAGSRKPPLFQSFRKPANDAQRVDALHATRILQHQPDKIFSDLIHLATLVTGAPMGFIDIVKEETVLIWAHRNGFDAELHRSESFCSTTINAPEKIMVVEDASQDPRFADFSIVKSDPGIRFYAGATVFAHNGLAIGTICVCDTMTRSLTEDQREGLLILAEAVTARVRLRMEMELVEAERRKFNTFMDSGPTVNFIKDHAGRYTYVNKRFLQTFRMRASDILGKTDAELWPHVGDQLAAHDRWVLKQPEPVELTEQGPLDSEGKPTWWRSYKFALPDDPPSLGGIALDISEMQAIQDQLRHRAGRDPLTGLHNRSALDEELPVALVANRQREETLAVLYMDLDRFKSVNDSLGHGAGDDLLKEFARRLLQVVRQADRVYRLGGDEFVIVLQHLRDTREATAVAGKILEAMKQPVNLGKSTVTVGTSIGIACAQGKLVSADALLDRADAALYEAKHNGRNCFALSQR